MAQTVGSQTLFAGTKIILIEKPHNLHRIFFSVQVFADPTIWHRVDVSLGDPLFHNRYVLDGPNRYFGAEGEDIFQGDIWARNTSDSSLLISVTEILR